MLIRLSRNWYVRRQDAWKIIYDHAIKSGVVISFGRPISGLNEQRPAVLFEDGSSMEGDLIVGADGRYPTKGYDLREH
jgi:hypothetical protein